MAEASAVRTLLNELSKGTAKEKAKALGELRRLADTEAVRSELIVMGHISKIIALLSRGDVECRIQAAGVIEGMAATEPCRLAIIATGVLEPLVGMLQKTQPLVSEFQEEAAGALRSLAASQQGQHAILAAGALPALVELLATGTAKGKARSGGTIGYLAAHLPKAEVKGFLPSLVAMLSSEVDEVSMAASRAVCNVCTTCVNRAAVVEEGGLAPLLNLLNNSSLKGRTEAAAALGALAVEGTDFEPTGEPPPAYAGPIVEAGAVPALVILLAGGVGEGPPGQGLDPTISNNACTQAARTVSVLAIETSTHPVLIANGAIPALVALLQEGKGSPKAKGWAASALEQLARDEKAKKEIYASVPVIAKTIGAQKALTAQLKYYC